LKPTHQRFPHTRLRTLLNFALASPEMATPQNSEAGPRPQGDFSAKNIGSLALLTLFAFLVMGYHPGLEDDAFYLAAIKRNLNPALFSHDADFFRLQFQATIFDKLIAYSIRLSHLPLSWTILLWQLAAIFFVLHGCWRISRRCFSRPEAHWASVITIAALLTLPLPGIAINLADQYLHPRTLATAAILAAIVAVLDRRVWIAVILLAIAFAVHAIMASFGISFCAFLLWNLRPSRPQQPSPPAAAALLVPLGWLFEPASDAWRQAAATRSFYYPTHWEWYEWLGIIAPLLLVYALRRRLSLTASTRPAFSPLVLSLLHYSVFQTAAGLLVMLPSSLERLRPLEPMRYLHLLYLLFFLLAGGLLGSYILDRKIYRWLLLFGPLSLAMFYAQRQLYPASLHCELPGNAPRNPWLQAFAWIRQNTPVDSLFAIGPNYMKQPGEDYHGFRALAERSVLADFEKDGGMAARVPRLAPRWLQEVSAQNNWQNVQAADLQRLKTEFGVTWVILPRSDIHLGGQFAAHDPQGQGMTCPYENDQLQVCRLY
jgi:hypothetical protein